MMMREENLTLAKRGYELFANGDFDTLRREVFSPDIVWRTAAHGAFEAEYKGVDAVLGYFTKLFELSSGTFRTEPVHILADDDRSVVIQHVSGTRDGKRLETEMINVFEVRDGKVYEVTQFVTDSSVLEAFWL